MTKTVQDFINAFPANINKCNYLIGHHAEIIHNKKYATKEQAFFHLDELKSYINKLNILEESVQEICPEKEEWIEYINTLQDILDSFLETCESTIDGAQ